MRATSTGVSDADIDKVTHPNAMTAFSHDPFTALGGGELHGRGARGQALGHDVAIRSVSAGTVGAHATKATDLYVPDTHRAPRLTLPCAPTAPAGAPWGAV